MRLYLIRHGETDWSATGQHTGSTDLFLTPAGEDEARTLKPRLAGIEFRRVFSSPLRRAIRTCELASIPVQAEIEPDLAEWDYGDFEGLTSAEILTRRPGWNLFRDGSPNGESPSDVCRRADRLIAKLRGLDGNVALFSHGHFGGVFAARWVGLSIEEGEHFPLDTASISILGYAIHHEEVSVIKKWNVTGNG